MIITLVAAGLIAAGTTAASATSRPPPLPSGPAHRAAPAATQAPRAGAIASFDALCDFDGPCLNATDNAAGHPITMFSFSSGDPYENIGLFVYAGDYGCTKVSLSCPFHDTTFGAEFSGDTMVELAMVGLTGSGCAAAYPNNNLNWEPCSTAPDRNVFVLDGYQLISPYWTNQNDAEVVLYGPPLGDQASVNDFNGSTRQDWTERS